MSKIKSKNYYCGSILQSLLGFTFYCRLLDCSENAPKIKSINISVAHPSLPGLPAVIVVNIQVETAEEITFVLAISIYS